MQIIEYAYWTPLYVLGRPLINGPGRLLNTPLSMAQICQVWLNRASMLQFIRRAKEWDAEASAAIIIIPHHNSSNDCSTCKQATHDKVNMLQHLLHMVINWKQNWVKSWNKWNEKWKREKKWELHVLMWSWWNTTRLLSTILQLSKKRLHPHVRVTLEG